MRPYAALPLLALLAACGDDTAAVSTPDAGDDTAADSADTSDDSEGSATTTWAQAAPVFAEHCVSCHTDGGAAPFALDTYAQASIYAGTALAAMQSGAMPPFPPDVSCGEFAHPRVVSADEVAIISSWVDDGILPSASVTEPLLPPTFETAFTADLTAQIGPYTPNAESPDDWRCFLTDIEFVEESWVKASRVVPDQLQVVHHALIYAISAVDVPAVLAADEDEEGAGYTCFGGPLPSTSDSSTAGATGQGGFPNQLGAWVPGINPEPLPEGVARVIAPGSRVVVQMHYNTLTAEPVEDASTLEIMTTSAQPTTAATTVPVVQRSLDIPAGEAEVVAEAVVTNSSSSTATFRALMPHAHMLATRFDIAKLDEEGSEECLLEIPDWDFNWQQQYARPDDSPITAAPGESIRLRCTFDNSAENQPVINGERAEPRDVEWGESTLDEMCLLYVDRLDAYEPPPAEAPTACADIEECAAECSAGDLDCLLDCETSSTTCLSCTIRGSIGCGGAACLTDIRAAQDCLVSCGVSLLVFGGSPAACFAATCSEQYAAISECITPVLADEACADVLADCGL